MSCQIIQKEGKRLLILNFVHLEWIGPVVLSNDMRHVRTKPLYSLLTRFIIMRKLKKLQNEQVVQAMFVRSINEIHIK